jgi:nucleoside 2-deoxyribosyltransferase
MKVYLAGPITEDSRTHQWRTEATHKLGSHFEIDNPASSKFDVESLKEAGGDPETIHNIVDRHQSEILLPKSYQSVSQCDILLVNFAIEPKDRPMVGTIMEVAWAYLTHKTVIAIRGTGYYTRHPMIKGAVHAWADDLTEAIGIIKEFFTKGRECK